MEWTLVMDVDESLSRLAVSLLEVEITDGASEAVVADAGLSRLGVALEVVDQYPLDGTFGIGPVGAQLADSRCFVRADLGGEGRIRKQR